MEPALTTVAKLHGYGCVDNIQTPKSIAIMALRLGSEQEMGLWDVRDALHGAISDEAWRLMWDAMQSVRPSPDYYEQMESAACYLEFSDD